MQLRLTRRALDDLDLDISKFGRLDATAYSAESPVVEAFVERRSQDPTGQETTQLPVTNATVYNLHAGRYRGLTWHDAASRVVWLLGVGWHESGSKTDAYAVLKGRDEDGTLMPDFDDYLALELTRAEADSFVALVANEAPKLVAAARREPGSEITGCIANRINLTVTVETIDVDGESLDEVWVAFEMPVDPGDPQLPPYPEWIVAVLGAMVPVEVGVADLDFASAFPRPGGSRSNEVVVCWRSY